MTAVAALAHARAAGLALTVKGDRLHWRGPPPAAELLAELREHKTELLALLAAKGTPVTLPPAAPEQDAAERQDRASVEADSAPLASVPVEAAMLAAWEGELATLLAEGPAQRITEPEKAAAYFAAEARRRLALVRHDRQAAGLLVGFWRHAGGKMHDGTAIAPHGGARPVTAVCRQLAGR